MYGPRTTLLSSRADGPQTTKIGGGHQQTTKIGFGISWKKGPPFTIHQLEPEKKRIAYYKSRFVITLNNIFIICLTCDSHFDQISSHFRKMPGQIINLD